MKELLYKVPAEQRNLVLQMLENDTAMSISILFFSGIDIAHMKRVLQNEKMMEELKEKAFRKPIAISIYYRGVNQIGIGGIFDQEFLRQHRILYDSVPGISLWDPIPGEFLRKILIRDMMNERFIDELRMNKVLGI